MTAALFVGVIYCINAVIAFIVYFKEMTFSYYNIFAELGCHSFVSRVMENRAFSEQ